jgi:Protein of unknown function (DUF1275)
VGVVHVLIVLSALAMGIQAAAVRRLGVPGIVTTYITGTLTSLMADLVGWLRSLLRPSTVRASAETGGADAEAATNGSAAWDSSRRSSSSMAWVPSPGPFCRLEALTGQIDPAVSCSPTLPQ